MTKPRIYLDHAATTPIRPEARAAMLEGLERWANPSSPHAEGRAARAALEDARWRICVALDFDTPARPGTLYLTSGATEAIDIAARGMPTRQLAATAVEHDAVLRAAEGGVRIPVGADGVMAPDAVADLPPDIARVFVQHVNSETGVIQPIDAIQARLRDWGALCVCDCSQSAGRIPLPTADMLILSSHKAGGPPGAGALMVTRGEPARRGGQEQGVRPGTENGPAIAGFAAALDADRGWMTGAAALRSRLEARLVAAGAVVVAADAPRIATIGAYRMPGVHAASQLIHFDLLGMSVSAGSACSSGSLRPSHVLTAMGWPEDHAREVVRVSFGPQTGASDVDAFADAWERLAARRRAA